MALDRFKRVRYVEPLFSEVHMIGHYLLALDTEAEDRILTTRLSPGQYFHCQESIWQGWNMYPIQAGDRCLVGAAAGWGWETNNLAPRFVEIATWENEDYFEVMVEERYDVLCGRFGPERINRVIRERIMTNRLWREMTAARMARKAWLGMVNEVLQEA